MTDALIAGLYHVTVLLKIPVILGVLLALLWALYQVGGFLREALDRRAAGPPWREFLATLPSQPPRAASLAGRLFDLASPPGLVGTFTAQAREHAQDAQHLDRLAADAELEATRRFHRLRIGIRVGPILGLMGTLIPMGPALMSLSTGNLEGLAKDLIIAFSTTVVGLLVGALCYVMLLVRQVWYGRDLADIEHLLQRVLPPGEATDAS